MLTPELIRLIERCQDFELAHALTREHLVRLARALGVRATGTKLEMAVEIQLEVLSWRTRPV